MSEPRESWHTCDDGHKLYSKSWLASSAERAKIVFLHGFSDHCNQYNAFFARLNSFGISVVSFDQRGWGRSVQSPRQRGDTRGTKQVLNDISSILRSQLPSSTPLFLMGHSMGGGECLYYAAKGPIDIRKNIRGYLTETPYLLLTPASQPWRITVAAGRAAGKLMPRFQLEKKLRVEYISRDPEVQKMYEKDPLCHDIGTLEAFEAMIDRGIALHEGQVVPAEDARPEGSTGMWISTGSGDCIIDSSATRHFATKLVWKDKEYKEYEGWYHQLHNEPGEMKNQYAHDVAQWVLARTGQP